jgi:asparagine synthase (glutamine-hydrolysing)
MIGYRDPSPYIERVSASLAHRGPDAEGSFVEEGVCFIHRRLSIIDLSAAANQPFHSADGKWVLVFNGEMYNYRELRDLYGERGYTFRTHSDTEVVLAAFDAEGPACLERFIGMFAFALYNRHSRELFVARDRVGVKPLYYSVSDGRFAFASELRAMQALCPGLTVNQDAIADFLAVGYIRAPYTPFTGVHKLLPGHYLILRDGQPHALHRYWSPEAFFTHQSVPRITNASEARSRLREIMANSAAYRMVADVPVGVFLSGGIDSSLLTALLRERFDNIQTFSIGFDEARYNEAPYAAAVARHLGTRHHERILDKREVESALGDYFNAYDEPFADSSGIPTILLSRFAASEGCKVVLSADGGDELFGGYTRYWQFPGEYARLHRMARFPLRLAAGLASRAGLDRVRYRNFGHRLVKFDELLRVSAGPFSARFYEQRMAVTTERKIRTLCPGSTGNNAGLFSGRIPTAGAASLPPGDLMALWDFTYYLPDDLLTKVDRATMHNSIEGREPFLDHRLVEFAFSLDPSLKFDGAGGKRILKDLLATYIPSELVERPKQGFSIPLFQTIHARLIRDFEEWLNAGVPAATGFLSQPAVEAEYRRFRYFQRKGKESNVLFMWHLYCLIQWWLRWGK